ncbi:MAG TPA: hypothetical protein VF950_02400 [Planctomycetota bacterium]
MKRAHAVLWLALAACRSPEPGTGPHVVDREYARPAGALWSAAVQSVREEGRGLRSASYDRDGGTLEGDALRVSVKPAREARGRVSIRVGPDEEARARRLHDRIAEILEAGGRP